ncbi:MAG: conjugal transfer protein TraF [Woeseiaceae bacterium]|nr:conjugal transfer protein TraF [Woeseiaceae bacterium]
MKKTLRFLLVGAATLASIPVLAGPVYHPPGANLTYGDVTHGMRVQSASSNPAAAAADRGRRPDGNIQGTAISAAAGLEYGNIQEIWDFYDRISRAFAPSDPGDGGGGPGQDPGDKPDGGINIGDILDGVNPDIGTALDALVNEVVTQTAILALIEAEGYGRAWLAADVPVVVGTEYLGGTWTFGLGWSGNARAFGIAEPVDFDVDAARDAIQGWIDDLPLLGPQIEIGDIILTPRPGENAVFFQIDNDSSLVSKGTQTGEFNMGYSREGWSNAHGTLFWGVEGHVYVKRLSRLSVRYGDITDSEELFDEIRNLDYRTDEGIGVDVGVLWVADCYQLGAQLTNVNQPTFEFPDVNLSPYSSELIISFLEADQRYVMDRQLKLEASLFGRDRRWSVNLGADANAATDPLGDEYQWATLSAGYSMDNRWLPNVRLGYRQNLAGTELGYLSVGFTAFEHINFDVASALDTVKIGGTTLPRGLMMSIGFQVNW